MTSAKMSARTTGALRIRRVRKAEIPFVTALDKRVMLVGQGNKFEVWDEARWQAQQEKMTGFTDGDLPPELEGFTL